MIVKKISFPAFSGQTLEYSLTPIELKDYIDFDVKRVYYLNQIVNNAKTGAHAHYKEKELFVVLQGEVILQVHDEQGLRDIKMTMNDGVVISSMVWHHFKDIKQGTVILALSSTNYSPNRDDYIEDYQRYLQILDD